MTGQTVYEKAKSKLFADAKIGAWLPHVKRHGFDNYQIHAHNNHMKNTYVRGHQMPWDAEEVHQWTPEYETDRALEFIQNKEGKQRNASQLFAMVISWNPPHTPL